MANFLQSAGGGVLSGSEAQTGKKCALSAGSDAPLVAAPLGAPTGLGTSLCASPSATAAEILGARRATALPQRAGHMTLAALIDLYMTHYEGRDATRVHRLNWWVRRMGQVTLIELSDDHVHEALQALAQEPNRFFAGLDATGEPIYKARRKPLSPATLNRYAAALAAVITWAIKKRIAPKAYVHPCRTLEHQPENNERVRFLTDDERCRLLQACQASAWPLLHLMVLMALTTGARKGDLTGLRWQDIDFERELAFCGRTKNGDPRLLPLVPPVMALLRQQRGRAGALVFESKRTPGRAFDFKMHWDRALNAARIRHFRFHDLRHSCATMLAQSGATLLEIADVLGHRQLEVTKRYSHFMTAHKTALINRVWKGV